MSNYSITRKFVAVVELKTKTKIPFVTRFSIMAEDVTHFLKADSVFSINNADKNLFVNIPVWEDKAKDVGLSWKTEFLGKWFDWRVYVARVVTNVYRLYYRKLGEHEYRRLYNIQEID